MEYVQMTLDDWMEMKQRLRQELLGVKQSFVRIGYVLRQIEDQRLYEQDGYKSTAEFAKGEYGLEPSTTSRFMAINREYSVDGYSEHLRPEYADLGRSQLEEMLKLPDNDRQMICPETPREDIRELKRFNKTAPAAGVADDLMELVEKFYYDNPDILNAVFSGNQEDTKKMAEIINPGGIRSYKKGLYFLMMYENHLSIKKFGSAPQKMTWEEFVRITVDIFGGAAEGAKTWNNYFGGETDTGEAEEIREEEIAPAQNEEVQEKEGSEQSEAVPVQSMEIQEYEEAERPSETEYQEQMPEETQIPGQDTILSHPEYLPDDFPTDVQVDGEAAAAAVEPVILQRKEECLSLLSTIQGNVALEKYEKAYQAAEKLLQNLEVMKR